MSLLSADHVADLNRASPAWRVEQRSAALEAAEAMEMPDPADEVWRYVDLDFDIAEFGPPAGPGPAMADGPFLAAVQDRSGTATVIDGHVVFADSTVDGVALTGLADAGDVGSRSGSLIPAGRNIFTASHAALSPDGLVLHAAANSHAPAPFVVDMQFVSPQTAGFPHLTVVADRNSEISVIVVLRSPDGADLLAVPHIESFVGDGARLRIAVVQAMGSGGRAVGAHQMTLGRDATGRIGEVGLGGDFARLHLGVDLVGAGSSFNGAGLYFGDRDQVHDYRVFITHSGPRTSSDLFLKGAVEDTAHAVWTGLVRIEHGANGTSAFETNRNLVLSDGARVDSVPNLEILTDDLQCGHGSSSGPLEEEHLYYLMSRGIRRERAERLLVRGFFEEIVQVLPVDQLAEPVRDAVYAKYLASQDASA